MIVLKTQHELERMKKACRISADALNVAQEVIKPVFHSISITAWSK